MVSGSDPAATCHSVEPRANWPMAACTAQAPFNDTVLQPRCQCWPLHVPAAEAASVVSELYPPCGDDSGSTNDAHATGEVIRQMVSMYQAGDLGVSCAEAWDFVDRYTRSEAHAFSACTSERQVADYRVATTKLATKPGNVMLRSTHGT